VPGSAPGAPRRLAGEADRERLVALLREHYALGQLDDDELDRRVGVVLGARYMDEAASAVTDLPQLAAPGTAGSRPARQRRGHAQAAKPASEEINMLNLLRDPETRAVIRV